MVNVKFGLWRAKPYTRFIYAGRMSYMNLVVESLVAQCLEHPPGVWKIIGSNPVGDSDFFLCPTLRHDEHCMFPISKKLLKERKSILSC